MISSFLKKLLFARQFYMIDGKIELLGKKQVMLPYDVVEELEKGNARLYAPIKKAVLKNISEYAKKLGSSEDGILKNIDYLFETFGLGTLQIVELDYKKKRCIVTVRNSPLSEASTGLKITEAVISGIFTFILSKDVNARQMKKAANDYQYLLE